MICDAENSITRVCKLKIDLCVQYHQEDLIADREITMLCMVLNWGRLPQMRVAPVNQRILKRLAYGTEVVWCVGFWCDGSYTNSRGGIGSTKHIWFLFLQISSFYYEYHGEAYVLN